MTFRQTRILALLFLFFMTSYSSGQNSSHQKNITNDNYGFSFDVDTAFWKTASIEKIASKARYDMTRYLYIFTRDNDSIMSRPFILITTIPTEKNEFKAETKREGKQANISQQKDESYFPNISRILISDSTIVDTKRKSMSFLFKTVTTDNTNFSVMTMYYREKYILQFVLSTESLEPALSKFNSLTTSVKFFATKE